MTKKEIQLVLVAVFIVATFGVCLALFASGDRRPVRSTVATDIMSPRSAQQSPKVGPVPVIEHPPGGDQNFDLSSPAFQFPATGYTVPDEALLRLCALVNVANSVNEPPDKQQWRDALPIAQKLLVYPCDCAQRNWLSHFVETGTDALQGSEQEYHASAQLLVTLGRNNAQAVAISKGIR